MGKYDAKDVKSPCVSICALDENEICVGCYRTGMEISRWGGMSGDEKREVMMQVKEREKSSYI
ncbi:DUF1289 domain-containing protein [Alkalimarinus alittae]|uniref:DUF1289 domain-containing protein n=1 Tax=Alkalimarinus alittae TaxID=2961619 RepID=A0ABY6MYM4_9ALTE|nr:DUF1289 domain-containing protein [Alkalimarinus alittae]UZE94900.1 DUF1289 domain-containing protein [Alkalimarinus alittae]